NLLLHKCCGDRQALHSVPTRRSSDLHAGKLKGKLLGYLRKGRPDYLRRIENERKAFDNQVQVHDLPEIFHYWSHKYLGPKLHPRSEEHTSELQSRENIVCRLLLEKKK